MTDEHDQGGSPAAAFLVRCYDETAALLVDARDYLSDRAAAEAADLPMAARIQLTQELTVMTRRLTEAMSWLLLRRAVAAGEITADAARTHDSFNLADEPALVEGRGAAIDELPLAARGLIDRSRRLYAQLARLRASLDSSLA